MLTALRTSLVFSTMVAFHSTRAEIFYLELEPATEFQDALPNAIDRTFFRPVRPMTHSVACTDSVCGGAFAADFSLYNSFHVTFQSNEPLLIRPDPFDPRVRVAFTARTDNCTDGDLVVSKKIKANKIEIEGSDTEELHDNFDEKVSRMLQTNANLTLELTFATVSQNSYVQITECSIDANLEFIPADEATVFEGNITSIFTRIALNTPGLSSMSNQTYWFNTDNPMWIQVPVAPTSAPTMAPTATPTLLPTLGPTKEGSGPLQSEEESEPEANSAGVLASTVSKLLVGLSGFALCLTL